METLQRDSGWLLRGTRFGHMACWTCCQLPETCGQIQKDCSLRPSAVAGGLTVTIFYCLDIWPMPCTCSGQLRLQMDTCQPKKEQLKHLGRPDVPARGSSGGSPRSPHTSGLAAGGVEEDSVGSWKASPVYRGRYTAWRYMSKPTIEPTAWETAQTVRFATDVC